MPLDLGVILARACKIEDGLPLLGDPGGVPCSEPSVVTNEASEEAGERPCSLCLSSCSLLAASTNMFSALLWLMFHDAIRVLEAVSPCILSFRCLRGGTGGTGGPDALNPAGGTDIWADKQRSKGERSDWEMERLEESENDCGQKTAKQSCCLALPANQNNREHNRASLLFA